MSPSGSFIETCWRVPISPRSLSVGSRLVVQIGGQLEKVPLWVRIWSRSFIRKLLTLNFCKPLIDPFAPQYKPKFDGSVLENESVLRQNCRQDLRGITAPYFYNWGELILAWRVKDGQTEMRWPLYSRLAHDLTSQQSCECVNQEARRLARA